jgi:hypothetical protein
MMGAHILREPGEKESVPMHVLIQSHIQPSNTLLSSFDHISDYVLDDGRRAYSRRARLARGGGSVDGGVWQRLLRLGGGAGSKTIRIEL